MMKKKGMLKTAEALIAIVICLMFIVLVYSRIPRGGVPETEMDILHTYRDDAEFRNCVIERDLLCADTIIESSIPQHYSFYVTITDEPENAELNISATGVFRETVLITGNMTDYKPSVVSLYYWVD